jgi:hypothetical protein
VNHKHKAIRCTNLPLHSVFSLSCQSGSCHPPAEPSVHGALVRANEALIEEAASPDANDPGYHSALEPDSSKACHFPPDRWCGPGRICCDGFCMV